MGHQGHSYRIGQRGRSVTTRSGAGGTVFTARLTCAACGHVGERNLRALMPDDQIDRKFIQAGWSLDPNSCVDCRARAAKEKVKMASKPTPGAIKAQAKMFNLLSTHFDGEAGKYAAGWDDAKIGGECALPPALIAEFRREAFGEIKEPPEVRAFRDDLTALEQLAREQAGSLSQEITAMRGRLADISKRWAA